MSANLASGGGSDSGASLTIGASNIYSDGSRNCYIPYIPTVNPPLSGYWSYPPTRAEKPEDTIARATRELAAAAKQLEQSADALGLDLDKRAIHKAVYKRVAEALGD